MTKAKEREKASEQKTSSEIRTIADDMKSVAKSANDNYSNLQYAPGSKYNIDDKIKLNNINKNLTDIYNGVAKGDTPAGLPKATKEQVDLIINGAKQTMLDAKSSYELSREVFKRFIDRKIDDAKKNMGAAKEIIENLNDITKSEDSIVGKIKVRQHSPVRDRLGKLAPSPENKFSDLHSTIDKLKEDKTAKAFSDLLESELVVNVLGKASASIKAGDFAKALDVIEKGIDRELDNRRKAAASGGGPVTPAVPKSVKRSRKTPTVQNVSITAPINQNWVKYAEKYYQDMQSWANITDDQNKNISGMLKNLNSGNSTVVDGIKLFKEVAKIFVDQSGVVSGGEIGIFKEKVRDVVSLEDATKVSRALNTRFAVKYENELLNSGVLHDVHMEHIKKHHTGSLTDDDYISKRWTSIWEDIELRFEKLLEARLAAQAKASAQLSVHAPMAPTAQP